MTNSRLKGATGEREFAAAVFDTLSVRLLRQLDQCRGGGFDLAPEPDNTTSTAEWMRQHAIEVKRYRTVTAASVAEWWRQAVEQADNARLAPLLAYRADRQPWLVVIALDALAADVEVTDTRLTATLTLEGLAALARTASIPMDTTP